MSIFSDIDKVAHTFAAWAEKQLAKIFKTAPTIAQVTDTVIDYIGPILEEIVTAQAGQPAGAFVTSVISGVQTGLVAIGGLIYDIGAAPTIAAKVQALESDLSGLLSNGLITDTKSVSLVTLVVRELGALVDAFSTKPAAPVPAPAPNAG